MKGLWKLPIILTITTVIAASALSLVNNSTKPLIEEHKAQALQEALVNAMPAAHDGAIVPVYQQNNQVDYYKAYSDKDTTNLIGYIFKAEGTGYSSTIVSMVGVDTSGVIRGVIILEQLETPGLGAKVQEVKYGDQEPWFQKQFKGKTIDQLAVDKDGGEINSITGATISSRAVTKSIREGIENLAKKMGGFPEEPKPVI